MKYVGLNTLIGVYAAARYYFNALRLKVIFILKVTSQLMAKLLSIDWLIIMKYNNKYHKT